MGFLVILPALLSALLAASTTASPVTCGDKLVVTRNFFLNTSIKYTSQHDIVNLVVPLNRINFDDDDDDDESDDEEPDNVTVFFTEADVDAKGDRDYKGLYVFNDGKATKVLANGRDATAFNDDSKKVYIGATDGIYVYENGTTKKYGALSDSIIQIEADNQTETIYFLTEDHLLFSVADDGNTTINKVEDVSGVQEFIIDYVSNIYYYDADKHIHVFNQEGVKKFDGLRKATDVKLVRPMFAQDQGIFAVIDKKLYLLHPNGTSEKTGISFQVTPTAYAPDATLLQYYAFEKKIYEFNVMELLASELTEVKEFLDDKKNDIQNIATKSRSAFGT